MIKHITLISIFALTAFLTALIFVLPTPDKTEPTLETALLIENVRVVQNGELSTPQSILIRDGLIVDIGPDIYY